MSLPILRACSALAVAILATLCCGGAAAQQALWVAAPGERGQPWYTDVCAALEAEGVVISEALGVQPACTPALARAAAEERGVALGLCVWVREGEAIVDLARVGGPAGQGRASIGAGVGRAMGEAYRRAEVAVTLGGRGLLRVSSTPQGALATLDGEPIGHAPFERRLAPGSHALRLSLEGFADAERSVEVKRGRVIDLDVRLVPESGERAAQTSTSPLNYVLGGVLVLAAVPALGFSIATLAQEGECDVRDAAGICTERVNFGARSGVLLGAGIAALAAGALFLIWQPLEVEVSAGEEGAALGLRSRF